MVELPALVVAVGVGGASAASADVTPARVMRRKENRLMERETINGQVRD
jgi:hypothetical protein